MSASSSRFESGATDDDEQGVEGDEDVVDKDWNSRNLERIKDWRSEGETRVAEVEMKESTQATALASKERSS